MRSYWHVRVRMLNWCQGFSACVASVVDAAVVPSFAMVGMGIAAGDGGLCFGSVGSSEVVLP